MTYIETMFKAQVQDKETQLKKHIKAIKSIGSHSGFSWDQNASMIKTTPEKWEEVIEEDQKLKMYEKESFLLFKSLDQLYEGKHCFTSSKDNHVDLKGKYKAIANTIDRKRARDGSAGLEAHMDTLQRTDGIGWRSLEVESERHEEENTVHSCQSQEDIRCSFGDILQQGGGDDPLDDEEHDAEHQVENGEHASASHRAPASHKRKSKKHGAPVPCVEETMSAFVNLKRE